MEAQSLTEGTKLFVGNLSFDASEEELAEHFGKIGKVVSAKIVTRWNKSRGYGFVEFETQELADKAKEELDKSILQDRPINVERAQPPNETKKPPRRKSRKDKPRGQKNGPAEFSKTGLYVTNLPYDLDDKQLGELFGGYKTVSFHVVFRPSGKSKGYGFVEMETEEEKERARSEMNHKEVQGRRIKVDAAIQKPAKDEKESIHSN